MEDKAEKLKKRAARRIPVAHQTCAPLVISHEMPTIFLTTYQWRTRLGVPQIQNIAVAHHTMVRHW